MSTTPAIRENFLALHFFHILSRAYLSPLYICRLNFCLVFIFRPRQAGIISTSHRGRTRSPMLSLEPPWNDAYIENYFKPKRRYLRPPKSETAADSFIRTTWKDASIDTPHTLITGVDVTGNKFIAGVVVTGDKFIAGINDTGNHWKSLTPVNNLSPVSLTLIKIHLRISQQIFKKFERAPREYSRARGPLIHEKNLKS